MTTTKKKKIRWVLRASDRSPIRIAADVDAFASKSIGTEWYDAPSGCMVCLGDEQDAPDEPKPGSLRKHEE